MATTAKFDRLQFVGRLAEEEVWDIIIIGGGATGLGIAVDSASRGYKTLLLERADFAKGTSSRSTKLIHGGVRYLAQGNIRLVFDALRERGILWQNAPHLVRKQAFLIPCYSRFTGYKYLAGLKFYDLLSGHYSFGQSRFISRSDVIKKFPHIKPQNLLGGVVYYDGQFDDARLAIHLAQTAAIFGGVLINYCKVTALLKEKDRLSGVVATDLESNVEYRLQAKAVVNATGVFVDEVLQMDVPTGKPMVQPSQGTHLVVDGRFLASDDALMIPETPDGRVIFAVPWNNRLLLGTTDTPLQTHSPEPAAQEKEVDFILSTIKNYLSPAPTKKDVLSVFAGLRPLAATTNPGKPTKEISRDHKLFTSPSGLITITGGKWTTYRKMGEQTVDTAIRVGGLSPKPCLTKTIRIQGSNETLPAFENDITVIAGHPVMEIIRERPELAKKLVDHFPYTEAEVVWCVRAEMARTVEDLLARRLRMLFLDAAAAIKVAPRVAALMAGEMAKDEAWEQEQVAHFKTLAQQYLLTTLATTANEEEKSLT
jgi:glycerol-3-phosphate dehydrogenase